LKHGEGDARSTSHSASTTGTTATSAGTTTTTNGGISTAASSTRSRIAWRAHSALSRGPIELCQHSKNTTVSSTRSANSVVAWAACNTRCATDPTTSVAHATAENRWIRVPCFAGCGLHATFSSVAIAMNCAFAIERQPRHCPHYGIAIRARDICFIG
jgi:hypothetical protein